MSALAEFGQTREEAEIAFLETEVARLEKDLRAALASVAACVLAENEACALEAETASSAYVASQIRARRSR